MAEHTPGPWTAGNDGPDSFTITSDVSSRHGPWKLVAELYQSEITSEQCTSEEIEANARLIAAAPDLLEACCYAIGKLSALARTGNTEPGMVDESLRAAILKATGKTL